MLKHSEKFVEEAFDGSLPAFLAAFTARKALTPDEVAQLRRLVAEYLYAFYQHKENRGLDIFADCNALQ